jgi:hypothetical protein
VKDQDGTPDDGQRNCPKPVEFPTRINLEISASVGFIVKKFVTMHGHMNIPYCFFTNRTSVCMNASRPFNRRAELSESQTNPHISITTRYLLWIRNAHAQLLYELNPLAMADVISKEMFLGHIVAYTGTPLSSSVAFFSLVTSRAHVGASV